MEHHWSDVLAALADPDQPGAALRALERIARQEVGARLVTVSTYDFARAQCRRIHTSDAVAYPLSGLKPVPEDAWFAEVIVAKRTYVANSIAEMMPLFPDHAQIAALGCGSVVNLPVVVGGTVVSTLNLLDVAGHYTPERVARVTALTPFAAMATLAALTNPLP
jgi:hypothetical protein